MDKQRIEHISLSTLTPHPQNSRTHSDAQVLQVAASIEQFGFRGCIVIDETDTILAGHGRALAMRRLGRDTIPCQRVTGLSDAEKRAYLLADNQTGLNSEWDAEIHATEVAALTDLGMDLSALGISAAALSTLETAAPKTAADVAALEAKSDQAPPATHEQFEAEMARADTAGLLPIVPLYAEHHEAFIIICDNAIDEAWMRNKLGLDTQHKSYKDVKAMRPNVITVQDFRARISA